MDEAPLQAVRLVIDNGEPAAPPDHSPDQGEEDGRRGRGRPPSSAGLPEGCPVIPLGVLDDKGFFLDPLRQLRVLAAKDFTRLGIAFLFGRQGHLLIDFWPAYNKDGDPTGGWKPELAAMALSEAAHGCGVWDPFKRVRGAGAWLAEDGGLVLHCGDGVLIDGAWREPGVHDRHVYPAAAPYLRPDPRPARAGERGPAAELLALLKTWNWRRPDIDPQLLLGWIAAAMIGGALKWRPAAWITGGPGTGKSTLQDLLSKLFDESLLTVVDPSAAGIRQTVQHSTLPVSIDETEAEENNHNSQQVIKLARMAASGALSVRGGADHHASGFMLRNCFLFSSVLVPPLLPQDRSRIAVLDLNPLADGSAAPALEPKALRKLGAALLRRLVDQFHRLPRALEAYRAALGAEGHDARGADVFGTLLACADLLRHDEDVESDSAAEWADLLKARELAELGDSARDEERCLQHLLSTLLPLNGPGMQRTVASWAASASGGSWQDDTAPSRDMLQNYGLKLIEEAGAAWLAVANSHQGVSRIFANTHWAARSGALGVWVQALRRLPGAKPSGKALRIGGVAVKATVIPGGLFIDPEAVGRGARQGLPLGAE